jgi:hypothetical protein
MHQVGATSARASSCEFDTDLAERCDPKVAVLESTLPVA